MCVEGIDGSASNFRGFNVWYEHAFHPRDSLTLCPGSQGGAIYHDITLCFHRFFFCPAYIIYKVELVEIPITKQIPILRTIFSVKLYTDQNIPLRMPAKIPKASNCPPVIHTSIPRQAHEKRLLCGDVMAIH